MGLPVAGLAAMGVKGEGMSRIVEFRDDNVGVTVEVEVTPGPEGVVAIRTRQTVLEMRGWGPWGRWGPSISLDLRDED